MTDSVAHFCLLHGVTLQHTQADNFRLVKPGTITHRTHPYGSSRSAITNGVIAYVFFGESVGIKHCEHSNLKIVLDTTPAYKAPKPKRPAATRGISIKDIYKYVI